MDPDAAGARPAEVALATRCMIVNLGLALFGRALAYAYLGFPLLSWRVAAWLLLGLTLRAGFIALIWHGVSWARKWLLLGIGCLAAIAIWSLLFATATDRVFQEVAPYFTTLSGVTLLIDFYTAYLLLQPESAEWFRR
jgi:hypothetical protein